VKQISVSGSLTDVATKRDRERQCCGQARAAPLTSGAPSVRELTPLSASPLGASATRIASGSKNWPAASGFVVGALPGQQARSCWPRESGKAESNSNPKLSSPPGACARSARGLATAILRLADHALTSANLPFLTRLTSLRKAAPQRFGQIIRTNSPTRSPDADASLSVAAVPDGFSILHNAAAAGT